MEEAGGGLDDDLTLIGAPVDDAVPLRTVCEGETDGIQHGGLAGSLGAGDLHGLPSRVVSRMPNRFLITIFEVFIDKTLFLPLK